MESADDPLCLNRQICFRLYAASNLLTRRYRPSLRKLGLTYPQYLVMLALWETSPQTIGDIGRRLFLDSGTLTPLLKRLELANLILRRRDVGDERRVLVELSPAGQSLKKRARHVPFTLARNLGLQPDTGIKIRDAVDELLALLLRGTGH